MPGEYIILLAEDNEDDVVLIKRAFKKAGMAGTLRLEVVRDGEEAIAYLAGEGKYADRKTYALPDLLLLDLKMPLKDGFEVLKWVREQPGLRALRVVALTSANNIFAINEAYQLGANSVLVKQTDFDKTVELAQAVGRYWLITNQAPKISRAGDANGGLIAPLDKQA